VETKKPIVVKYGLNHVTYLIEQVCNLWSQYTVSSYSNNKIGISGSWILEMFSIRFSLFGSVFSQKSGCFLRRIWMSMNRGRHN
jgi:hypothetical protein